MSVLEWGDDERGRLSKQEATQLGSQIAALTASGLPLPSGLRAMGEELPRGRLRAMSLDLAEAIERGSPLDGALLERGERMPAFLRGLVQGAAHSGNLGQIIARFVKYALLGNDIHRGLWLSIAYPCLALTLAMLLGVFICASLANSFAAIYRDFGIPLAVFTRLSLDFAMGVREAVVWLPAFLLVGLVFWGVARVFLPVAVRRSLACRIPLLGPVWRWTSLAEFFHLLGLFVESRIPLGEAIRLAGEGVDNAGVKRACRSLVEDVEGGLRLSEALRRQPYFPGGPARILAWSEEHQELAEALHMVAEMCTARARSRANFASTVFGVAAVLSIVAIVGFVVCAVLIPMLNLISRLSG